MTSPASVDGEWAARFAPVRSTFAANFDMGLEVGASFAATIDGELVVDLWGGYADAARTAPWKRDTMVNVFSTTKAMTALCAHMLVDRGLLDLDAPVARYWPEFAQSGKGTLPVHYLLSHRAGLAAIRQRLTSEAFYDWDRMVGALAAEAPWWEPGRTSGYHAMTFGYLVGELIRRVSGKTPGTFFRDEIAVPLGCDFHIGLPAAENHRVAEVVPPAPEETAAAGPSAAVDPESLLGKVMSNPPLTPALANQRAWRAAEIPAANGHGNARSVARVMAALARGGVLDRVRLLREETLARAIEVQFDGTDIVLGLPMRWGWASCWRASSCRSGPIGGPSDTADGADRWVSPTRMSV